MKQWLFFLAGLLFTVQGLSQDTAQVIIQTRLNSPEQQQKPYVILISADGFRYDYAAKYNASHLQELAGGGISAAAMIPSFPSVTFPNHYSMVTGLYPSHHGLVNNGFYDRNNRTFYSYKGKNALDPQWYGGSPLWVLAEHQHMLTASFYWVGSEVAIQNTYPTYRYPYNEKIGIHERIQTVVNWLQLPAERRPHLITFYFPEVDHAGHKYGPDAPETRQAVLFIDSAVNELNKAVRQTGLQVNFVFVSDHGMTRVNTGAPLPTPAAIDTSKFIVSGDGILVELYAKDQHDIKPAFNKLKAGEGAYRVYLRTDVPRHLHYGIADDRDNRIGDLLLIPNYPNVFRLNSTRAINPGWHGYDPALVREMLATFYAWGPAFKPGTRIPAFENVDVFPLIARLLNLQYDEAVDGKKSLAKHILK